MSAGIQGPRGRITTIFNTAHTLKDSDNGNTLCFDNAATITVTIPQALQIGWSAKIVQQGAGVINFATATGVTLNNLTGATGVAGQWAKAELTAIKQDFYELAILTAAAAASIPTADLLGGDGTDFTEVEVGASLLLNAGTLTVAVPTVRTVAGTTDTILAADHGNAVRYTNAGAIAVTVPAGLGAGFTCLLLQLGAGVFTVAGSGATVANRQSQFDSAGTSAQCSLFADAANHFIFGGDTA